MGRQDNKMKIITRNSAKNHENRVGRWQRIRLLVALSLLFPGAVLLAGAGTTSADFLTLNPSARSSAMAGADVGILDSASQFYSNPAVLGNIYRREGMLNYNYLGEGMNYTNANGMWATRKYGNFGGGLTYLSYGDIPHTGADRPDTIDTFNPKVFMAQASYGTRTKFQKWMREFPVGASLKYINQSYYETTGNSVAMDLGVGYMPRQIQGLTAGFSLLNLGFVSGLGETNDGLPIIMKLGAAYKMELDDVFFRPIFDKKILKSGIPDFLVTAEISKPRNDSFQFNFGIEQTFLELYFFRIGYEFIHDQRFLTLGIGGRIDEPYPVRFDFAYVPQSYLADQYKFTAVYTFDYFSNSPEQLRLKRMREKEQKRRELMEKARKFSEELEKDKDGTTTEDLLKEDETDVDL